MPTIDFPFQRDPEVDYTRKLADFDVAILAYEDALSDYRRVQKAAGDGDAAEDAVYEAREEVSSARARFDAAERALNT